MAELMGSQPDKQKKSKIDLDSQAFWVKILSIIVNTWQEKSY